MALFDFFRLYKQKKVCAGLLMKVVVVWSLEEGTLSLFFFLSLPLVCTLSFFMMLGDVLTVIKVQNVSHVTVIQRNCCD